MDQIGGNTVRVMIRCPVTGDSIATGLMTDPKSWDARQIGLNRAICPACKQSHAWNKNDTFLEGALGI
jgi:hypothetical protein